MKCTSPRDLYRLKLRTLASSLFKKTIEGVPDWPDTLYGFSYAPYRPGQDPYKKIFPTREQIKEDLVLIRPLARHIRTYSVEGTLADIPEIAETLGMQVTLGVWIAQDLKHNANELATAIDITRRSRNVERLLVGNEVLFRADVSISQLITYLEQARQQVEVPVSTSEIWVQWHETPELSEHTDFIAAHILPFWEGLTPSQASNFVIDRADELRQMYPGKPLLMSEIGWPSRSSTATSVTTSTAEQSFYLRTQVAQLTKRNEQYFIIEAFDQPWKTEEGLAGPHWGVFDAQRRIKLQRSGPLETRVNWGSIYRRFIETSRPRSLPRAVFSAATAYGLLVWAGIATAKALTLWALIPMSMVWAACFLTGMAVEVHEYLEIQWCPRKRRIFRPQRQQIKPLPKVSVHVPCCNEPPEMVEQTLTALKNLDYPDYEVLVIDNNTQERAVWKPVEQTCQRLGKRFRFFHVEAMPGYKAGALNYLMERTAPDVKVIAVVDADYCVDRNWLRHMAPHFEAPNIAVIQAPQNFRDSHESLFKYCCNAEYRGFFNIGMVIRNDHDAIIQHGTMTLVRRDVLQRLRWSDGCICEDAELGLRILENGLSTGYSPISYGKGLTPDTFIHFKKQRYRWAYGAVQIVKQHAKSLFSKRGKTLTAMQRYHFLAGWVPWAAEGLNYLLTLAALSWSTAMIIAPYIVKPVPWLFSTSLLSALLFRTLKVIHLYRYQISTDIREALAAILAGMALYPTIGKAVLSGTFTSRLPFFRTPKQTQGGSSGRGLIEAREELCMVTLFWLAIIGLHASNAGSDPDLWFWKAMLFAQSLPYLAAVVMAVLSGKASRLVRPSG